MDALLQKRIFLEQGMHRAWLQSTWLTSDIQKTHQPGGIWWLAYRLITGDAFYAKAVSMLGVCVCTGWGTEALICYNGIAG